MAGSQSNLRKFDYFMAATVCWDTMSSECSRHIVFKTRGFVHPGNVHPPCKKQKGFELPRETALQFSNWHCFPPPCRMQCFEPDRETLVQYLNAHCLPPCFRHPAPPNAAWLHPASRQRMPPPCVMQNEVFDCVKWVPRQGAQLWYQFLNSVWTTWIAGEILGCQAQEGTGSTFTENAMTEWD